MAFELRTELAEEHAGSYWYHRSGDEHALKHMGDVGEISRILYERKLADIDEDSLEDYLYAGGLLVVREYDGSGGAGRAAGIAVADRAIKPGIIGVIDVKALYVEPEHRCRGLAGFMLGKLITDGPITVQGQVMISNYGKELRISGRAYTLPGMHLQAMFTSTAEQQAFIEGRPPRWNGIRSISGSSESHVVFKDGFEVANLERIDRGRARVIGSDRAYENLAFAAIAALNE